MTVRSIIIESLKRKFKTLHEFNQDMTKIKNNYNSIKDKVEFYINENSLYRTEINALEFKNEDLKTEIMRLKHLNNKLSIKIMSKKDKEGKDNEQKEKIFRYIRN